MAADVSAAGALQRRMELQTRLWESAHGTLHRTGKRASAKDLCREIRRYLIKASDQRLILDGQQVIHKELLFTGPDGHGHWEIAVGTVRNFHRTKELPHFTRRDGGWFDFQLQIKEKDGRLDMVFYDFELRLPPDNGFDFVRFDLNPPGHGNEDDGFRSHIHLNADDDGLVAAAPVMSPFEILARPAPGGAHPPQADRRFVRLRPVRWGVW